MTNRLATSLSPYLLAYAEQPVGWYPWGQDAFDEAGRRGVPVMLSIGYSTCHWCHVMARESFSDPVIADVLNAGFVSVKVDREELPDVDATYMAAAAAFTQNLGWPLTVFATPEGRAFYAGTYWPPDARPPLPAFRDVLAAVREAWNDRRAQVEESAGVVAHVLASARTGVRSSLPSIAGLAEAAQSIASREDPQFGGFGGSPKFPVATTMQFLQTPLVREQAAGAASAATRALTAMAASPLHDEDGGFFRYATQRDWSVPHYERMLTDNAQLLDVATTEGSREVAASIAGFLLRVLQRTSGGFGSAQDSESLIDGDRSEGGYYRVPTYERIALVPPAVDGKVITGWNGLAIGALARSGARWGEPAWVRAAARAASYVLETNQGARGQLVRTSLDGLASDAVATTADLGLLARGLCELAAATGDVTWALAACEIVDDAVAGVPSDPVLASHGFTGGVEHSDGDLPSGPSALAAAALAAWNLGAGDRYREVAVDIVEQYAASALAQPFGHGSLLTVAAGLAQAPRQLVVVTDSPAGPLAQAALAADADVVAIVTPAQAQEFADAGFELFEGKGQASTGFGDGERLTLSLAFDCRGFVCRLPVSTPAGITASRA